jgi:citrate lyase subunit beta / citryl-CoA lyase
MDYGRTVLFIPGDRPHRTRQALASESDSVVLDLEDAVADSAKETARIQVANALQELQHPRVLVRVNAANSPEHRPDLEAVTSVLGAVAGVVLPKVESAAEMSRFDEQLSKCEVQAGLAHGRTRVVAVLESSRGVLAAREIAAADRVKALMFGTLDLAAELGVEPTIGGREFLYARAQLVLASRAAGLSGPIDGPHPDLRDVAALVAASEASRNLGFTGRVVLHPFQIAPVRDVFSPSASELEHARAVLAAHERAEAEGLGAIRLPDGTFIDRPVVARASALIAQEARFPTT